MPTAKPTVTDEHKQKYEQIMNVTVKSSAPTPTPVTQDSKMRALLASLPKAKGIGDKMFIFTGKKKIIVDGKDREEEKVKTVDPAKLETEKKEIATPAHEVPKPETVKIEAKTPLKTEEKSPTVEKKVEGHKDEKKKKSNKTLLIAGGIFLGLGVWTFIWMYVFGYIQF